jgi:putative transcriptional regulator
MVSHHPADETLAAYAAGTLDEGSAFVIAAHLALCPLCRNAVRDFECIGGALLSAAEPVHLGRLSEGAVMQEPAEVERRLTRAPGPAGAGAAVDRLISVYGRGPWKWRGFGVQSADVAVPVEDGVRVFLLKAAAGTHMPQHTHSGVELTLVLKGAFEHSFGRFQAGDLEEADDSIDHRPLVDKSSECICLVAMSGQLQLQGLAGKILQPFVRL